MERAILQLYELVEMYKDSPPKYKKLLREFNEARAEFEKKLNEEQKKELANLLPLLSNAHGQEMEEYFVEGFSLATRLITEAFYKEEA